MIKTLKFGWMLILSLFIISGCHATPEQDTSRDEVVDYENLSLDEQYSDEVSHWLSQADESEGKLHHLSLADGTEYVYAEGFTEAKVSYTYENHDGSIVSEVEATLLKGERNDHVFIKVTYPHNVDVVTLNAVEDQSQFY
ncbi:hypothetical protein LCM20_16485 [Halobacillus litoralis]|uniref:hypothetical protein n=1 Tax=Halobacillus litoralis TaxID=45668 RepID=UPI001CD63243|nr:hypothetical protein [Halobacillus litoralis]MCA0972207.1 hypothetical protein [Halobacillus litoralis]